MYEEPESAYPDDDDEAGGPFDISGELEEWFDIPPEPDDLLYEGDEDE